MPANRCGSEQRTLRRIQNVQGGVLEVKPQGEMPCTDKQAGVSKHPSKVGRGKAREGGSKGMVGATRVGFEVLGVAYGYCWAGCAGKIMLAKATWLPGTTPSFSMVRNVL